MLSNKKLIKDGDYFFACGQLNKARAIYTKAMNVNTIINHKPLIDLRIALLELAQKNNLEKFEFHLKSALEDDYNQIHYSDFEKLSNQFKIYITDDLRARFQEVELQVLPKLLSTFDLKDPALRAILLNDFLTWKFKGKHIQQSDSYDGLGGIPYYALHDTFSDKKPENVNVHTTLKKELNESGFSLFLNLKMYYDNNMENFTIQRQHWKPSWDTGWVPIPANLYKGFSDIEIMKLISSPDIKKIKQTFECRVILEQNLKQIAEFLVFSFGKNRPLINIVDNVVIHIERYIPVIWAVGTQKKQNIIITFPYHGVQKEFQLLIWHYFLRIDSVWKGDFSSISKICNLSNPPWYRYGTLKERLEKLFRQKSKTRFIIANKDHSIVEHLKIPE